MNSEENKFVFWYKMELYKSMGIYNNRIYTQTNFKSCTIKLILI